MQKPAKLTFSDVRHRNQERACQSEVHKKGHHDDPAPEPKSAISERA